MKNDNKILFAIIFLLGMGIYLKRFIVHPLYAPKEIARAIEYRGITEIFWYNNLAVVGIALFLWILLVVTLGILKKND